jgi:hypothetical protein
MNADEAMRGLRNIAELRSISPYRRAYLRQVVELIDAQAAQLAEAQSRERAAVNKLCYTCFNDNKSAKTMHAKSCDTCPFGRTALGRKADERGPSGTGEDEKG